MIMHKARNRRNLLVRDRQTADPRLCELSGRRMCCINASFSKVGTNNVSGRRRPLHPRQTNGYMSQRMALLSHEKEVELIDILNNAKRHSSPQAGEILAITVYRFPAGLTGCVWGDCSGKSGHLRIHHPWQLHLGPTLATPRGTRKRYMRCIQH
jgi:hypothetical protein